jgi:hypothetical protein
MEQRELNDVHLEQVAAGLQKFTGPPPNNTGGGHGPARGWGL